MKEREAEYEELRKGTPIYSRNAVNNQRDKYKKQMNEQKKTT